MVRRSTGAEVEGQPTGEGHAGTTRKRKGTSKRGNDDTTIMTEGETDTVAIPVAI